MTTQRVILLYTLWNSQMALWRKTVSIMEGVIDHKMDQATAVSNRDKYITTRHGQCRLWKTTSGWKLLIKWRDGNECGFTSKITMNHIPWSSWIYQSMWYCQYSDICMPSPLHWRGTISVTKSHIRKTTHKYGTEIPTSTEHAHKIGQKYGYFGEMQSH